MRGTINTCSNLAATVVATVAFLLMTEFLGCENTATNLPAATLTTEQLANQVAEWQLLKLMYEKDAQAFALERISILPESLEFKIARCAIILEQVGVTRKITEEGFSGNIGLAAGILKELAKDEEYAEALLRRIAEDSERPLAGDGWKLANDWEIRINNKATQEEIADLVRLATVVDTAKPTILAESINQMKERLRQAIARKPDLLNLLKRFSEASQPSKDIQESRKRVSELIKKAKSTGN